MFKSVSWKNVLLGGLVFLAISTILRSIESMLTLKYYMMPEYFSVWSKLMMPTAGPPPSSFMVYSAVFALISGLVIAFFYEFIRQILPKGYWRNVLAFTLLLFVLSFVLFTLTLFLLINLPLALQAWWLLTSLIIFFLVTLILAKFKPKSHVSS